MRRVRLRAQGSAGGAGNAGERSRRTAARFPWDRWRLAGILRHWAEGPSFLQCGTHAGRSGRFPDASESTSQRLSSLVDATLSRFTARTAKPAVRWSGVIRYISYQTNVLRIRTTTMNMMKIPAAADAILNHELLDRADNEFSFRCTRSWRVGSSFLPSM